MAITSFPTVENCPSISCENDTVVADLDGTFLRGHSSFPYCALVAFEVGGVSRLIFCSYVHHLLEFYTALSLILLEFES